MSHTEWREAEAKRPRIDASLGSWNDGTHDVTITEADRPFSVFLSSFSERSKHIPSFSDRKLIVYDMKVERPSLPLDYEENAWIRLKTAIAATYNGEKAPESLELLYQLCENLCQYDLTDRLFERLQVECHRYADMEYQTLSTNSTEGLVYLETVNGVWTRYCERMTQIRCIFLYLDRTCVASATTNPGGIWNMVMDQFRDYCLTPPIREKFYFNLLKLIELERTGAAVDMPLLQSSIRMLIDLSLYHSTFQERFLEETRRFYKAEGERLVKEIDMSDYLQHIADRVHQESNIRIKQYVDKSSKTALTAIVEEELLLKRVKYILDKSLYYFMDNNKVDDISLLYRLLKKVGQLNVCAEHFLGYVKSKGSSILSDHTPGRDTITMLVNFIRKMDAIAMHSFEEDEQFLNSSRDGCGYFINSRKNRIVEILAEYFDSILQNEKPDEKSLDRGMTIFSTLQEKDVFEDFYKRDLAKRLLFGKFYMPTEKSMVMKIKKECWLGYTSKLEGMLKDIKLSEELITKFKTTAKYNSPTMLNINVNVMTYGFWPSYLPIEVTLPPAFARAQTMYEKFYCDEFKKRSLSWQNTLGVCEVAVNYPKFKNKLILSLLQTVILLCFNDESRPSISFSDIHAATQLDELELRRVLKSLTCNEHKLLQKIPASDSVEQTDVFVFNNDFTSDAETIEMNNYTLNEVIKGNTSMSQTGLLPRDHQVDAAIVRIMKNKRTLNHGLLLSEVMDQVLFRVTASDVKKRIENLIEKEYMERTEDDGYIYLS